MKKRAAKVLLPLLFSFCCVFSGFLNVNVFAYDNNDSYEFIPMNVTGVRFQIKNNDTVVYNATVSPVLPNNYYKLPNFSENITGNYLDFTTFLDLYGFQINEDIFDYYVYGSSFGENNNLNNTYFMPNNVRVAAGVESQGYNYLDLSDINFYTIKNFENKGFSFSAKIEFGDFSNISSVQFSGDTAIFAPSQIFQFSVLGLPKDLSAADSTAAIITAINNQTSSLNGSIGQAADDIQQSIEDQYSGEPEEEFAVDDVITQHNEKMGVLSFGSDVMLQFLDMFQSANAGTAELTLPGFNITVENVEYSVWPDYSFNFEQLNEWVPALMSVIRVMLPAFVWLMVLRYCIKVFEDNFLAK